MEEPEATRPTPASSADDLDPPVSEPAGVLAPLREREEGGHLDEVMQESRKLVHALANAVSIISAFASALSDEVEAGHPARESVEEIAGAAQRAGATTRALGDLLRRAGAGGPGRALPGHGRA